MDWKRAIREEKAAMQRLVALLFALADLAERASNRSRAASALMFWILHPAACAVWTFVDRSLDALPEPIVRCGDAREDVMCLARCFRHLAHILDGRTKLTLRYFDDGLQTDSLRYGVSRVPPIGAIVEALQIVRPVDAPDTS